MDKVKNNRDASGTVYWITGLSGSGKTTIGLALKEELEKNSEKVIFLDGDRMRELISYDVGYTQEERLRNSFRYAGFCKLLQEQGFLVICCTISLFHELHQWNRQQISDYIEIFVDVTPETLMARNQKGLYTNDTKNLFGKDIVAEFPLHPDLTLENDQVSLEQQVKKIIEFSDSRPKEIQKECCQDE